VTACFCGCGRKVSGLSRGLNKQGRRTFGLLAKLREARERMQRGEGAKNPVLLAGLAAQSRAVDRSDPASIQEGIVGFLDDLVLDGEAYEAFWRGMVHGAPAPHNAREVKRRFQDWGKVGMTVCPAAGIPIERGFRAAMSGRA
jgi:hypothetical protein